MTKKTKSVVLAACVLALIVGGVCISCKRDGAPENPGEGKASALDQGAAALDSGDWSRAYDAFTDVLADDPNNLDAYYGRAAASTAIAEDHYRLAQAAATNQDAVKGQEEAAKADEYFQRSLDDCDQCLQLDANFADAYFLKGVAAQYQARWDDGIAAFSECVKLDPTRGEAYHRRGEIYDHTMDAVNAAIDFKKARELGYVAPDAEGQPEDLEDFSDLNYQVDEDESEDSPSGE